MSIRKHKALKKAEANKTWSRFIWALVNDALDESKPYPLTKRKLKKQRKEYFKPTREKNSPSKKPKTTYPELNKYQTNKFFIFDND